jgi:hypothetical protein
MTKKNRNGGLPDSRGSVRSFGENRICVAPDCRTKLSRYNPDDWCFAHRDQVPPHPVQRRRA